MPNHPQSERLSWGDTVFLNLERAGMPLNVACVCVFEGQIPLRNCIRFVESKLTLIPRFLKRVVPPPLNLGLPSWEYDPAFDIKNHVREVTLKHGTDTELKALAGKLFGTVMDRQHPLWDLTLVHGMKNNHTALILRMHHCLTDGIAGVGIVSTLLDVSPEVPLLSRKKFRLPVPPPDTPHSLMDGVVNSSADFVKRILSAWTDLLGMAERAAANGGALPPTDELSRLLPEITAFTERLRFNVLYRGPQKFAWAEIPLADVKTIRHTFETSVNDVVLALVTATIRRYLELHGDRVKGRLLRMMVPVNLRAKDSKGQLGNSISLVPVTIPLDIRNPRKLVAAVHERTEFLKGAHAAELVSLAGGLLGMFPSSVQALAGPLVSQVPFTPFNMVCTNVPGPQSPLYMLGHKMVRLYPYVPVGGEMALNCAILSYNDAMYFGFSGDVHAVPDMRRLEEFLKLSFTELREAAGIKPPAKKSPPKRKVRAKAQGSSKPASASAANGHVSIPPASVGQEQTARPLTEHQGAVFTDMIA